MEESLGPCSGQKADPDTETNGFFNGNEIEFNDSCH